MLIESGVFANIFKPGTPPESIESAIQTTSLDMLSEPVAYGVPHGFKPEAGFSVRDSLRFLGKQHQKEYTIPDSGFLATRHRKWLIPVKGDFVIPENYWLRANPKSTQGRLGNDVHLVADGVPNYDCVYGPWQGKLYVLFEPRYWDTVIYEDISFNQIRVSCGFESPLSTRQLREYWESDCGLVLDLDGNQVPLSSSQLIHEGVLLTLDLVGNKYSGLIGLRSKDCHDALDLKKTHDWEPFLDMIEAPSTRRLSIGNDSLFILNSINMYRAPKQLCAEMTASTLETQMSVMLHKAGFIDHHFCGTLTYEIENRGPHPIVLEHGQPAGRLVYYRTRGDPDKEYGDNRSNSSYQGQIGPRPAKQFGKVFDLGKDPKAFEKIAQAINKDKEPILVVPRSDLGLDVGSPTHFQGYISKSDVACLDSLIGRHGQFFVRGEMEHFPRFKQPIAYLILRDPSDGSIYAYQRSTDKRATNEARLHGKWSIGVGGHVRSQDGPPGLEAVTRSLIREAGEEVGFLPGIPLSLVGFINDDRDSVGQVHLGLVYVSLVSKESIRPKEAAIRQGGFYQPNEFESIVNEKGGVIEGWTQIALDALKDGRIGFPI